MPTINATPAVGMLGTTLWPPGRATVLISAFLIESPRDAEARDAILANVARIAL